MKVQQINFYGCCILIMLFFFFSITFQSFSQQLLLVLNADGTQSSYSALFTDEFNGDELSLDKWQNSYPCGRHLIANDPGEETLEYYTDGKNISFNNGIMSLVAKKERTCGNCESWKDSATINKNSQTLIRGIYLISCKSSSDSFLFLILEYFTHIFHANTK